MGGDIDYEEGTDRKVKSHAQVYTTSNLELGLKLSLVLEAMFIMDLYLYSKILLRLSRWLSFPSPLFYEFSRSWYYFLEQCFSNCS